MVAKRIVGVVLDDCCARPLAGLQCSHRHKRLIRRAWRVSAAQCAVKQRLVNRVTQHFPALKVNAINKQVGVKRGFADEGQHIASFRVQCHQSSAPVAKHVFNQFLQPDVQRQHDGVAGCGRTGGQLAHSAAARRSLHLVNSCGAVQLLLKTLLYAKFADVVRAAVVAFIFAAVNGFFFRLVDAAYVAHHMTAQLAVRVVAKQPCLDVHTRKAKTLGREAGHFFVCQAGADGQRFKVLGLFAQPLETPFVAQLNINHRAQRSDGFFKISHF